MSTTLIELRNVSRRFGQDPPALDDVSLSVETGEAVAILGPSAAGSPQC